MHKCIFILQHSVRISVYLAVFCLTCGLLTWDWKKNRRFFPHHSSNRNSGILVNPNMLLVLSPLPQIPGDPPLPSCKHVYFESMSESIIF